MECSDRVTLRKLATAHRLLGIFSHLAGALVEIKRVHVGPLGERGEKDIKKVLISLPHF